MPHRLVNTVRIGDKEFDYGSDIHWPVEDETPESAARSLAMRIAEGQNSGTLITAGDLYHAESSWNWKIGLDTSKAVTLLFRELRKFYDRVLYVPGNHCLRRKSPTDDPWSDFELPRGVLMPRGAEPLIEVVGRKRILLANLFYDGHFVPGHEIQGEDFAALINSTTDGAHLLRGGDSVADYRRMTREAARALTPDIDALVTHVPPHPSSSTWRINGEADPHVPANFEGQTVHVPDQDEATARLWGSSVEHVRRRLNAKTAMLGSNVFEQGLGAEPRDGLTVIFGHHHRDEHRTTMINGKNVHFRSHQRVQKR